MNTIEQTRKEKREKAKILGMKLIKYGFVTMGIGILMLIIVVVILII